MKPNFNSNIKSYNYYTKYNYVGTTQIKKYLKLDTNQKILDICFILLLLGDDFLPKMEAIGVDNINQLIEQYQILIDTNSDFKIIYFDSEYKINFESLILYLNAILKFEPQWNAKQIELYNKKIGNKTKNLSEAYSKYSDHNYKTNVNFGNRSYSNDLTKTWLMSNGIMIHPDQINLFEFESDTRGPFSPITIANLTSFNVFKPKQHDTIITNTIDHNQIINYLEGCEFIKDIYFNNKIKNLEWYYHFESSPTLKQLVEFINSHSISELIRFSDYTKFNLTLTKYLNHEQYHKYVKHTRELMIKNVIKNIIEQIKPTNPSNPTLVLTEMDKDLDYLISQYLIYDNIKYIFDCSNALYLKECLKLGNLEDIKPFYSDIELINDELNYKRKYLKYKAKYLALSQKTIN